MKSVDAYLFINVEIHILFIVMRLVTSAHHPVLNTQVKSKCIWLLWHLFMLLATYLKFLLTTYWRISIILMMCLLLINMDISSPI